jgi:hypothetical protein
MKGFYAMSADIQLVDPRYMDAGESVTPQLRAGTQDVQTVPFPPTGKRFTLDVCEVWRFGKDGPVEGQLLDGVGLLTQLAIFNLRPRLGRVTRCTSRSMNGPSQEMVDLPCESARARRAGDHLREGQRSSHRGR